MRKATKLSIGFFLLLFVGGGFAADKLVVHEWGTFTSLQDETGKSIGGINTDEEPVPNFVHELGNLLLIKPTDLAPIWMKGAPRCHPDVTMRLETPVIYFHLPPGQKELQTNAKVTFRGGWLTQYYPNAEADVPKLQSGGFNFGRITSATVGSLTWKGLRITGTFEPQASAAPAETRPATAQLLQPPVTKVRSWLAPRDVRAALVVTPANEAERFLFYRGVGFLDAPLRITRSKNGETLKISSQLDPALKMGTQLKIAHLWQVDARDDGSMAFRALKSVTVDTKDGPSIPAKFDEKDFLTDNRVKLRNRIYEALLEEGLFADEAYALLNTWEQAYFKSTGQRIFFLVPREWTDHYLPLELAAPADVSRVMIGRIEMVAPRHRALLAKIAAGPASNGEMPRRVGERYREFSEGEASGESRQIFPADYRAFLELGRFRNALLLEEQRRHPTPALNDFIKNYGLQAYAPRD